jgi:hypothetical protein
MVLDGLPYRCLNLWLMDVSNVIERLGGTKGVQQLTGLSKGRISQWRTENHIPRAWLMFLKNKRPSVFSGKREAKAA